MQLNVLNDLAKAKRRWTEKNFVCAAGVAAVGLPFFCGIVTVASSCFGCACVCVVMGDLESVLADRIGMAASRLLAAAAACVILLSFADFCSCRL